MRARWYDPTTGQFMSSDPLEAITQQPYSYAGDNPINETDPSGLCGDTSSWGSFWANCGSDAVKVAGPVVDVAAGAGCVALPEGCTVILAANTSIQEGLVGLQAAVTPGYSLSDALTAQVPIVTGDALGALGGWAGKCSRINNCGSGYGESAVGLMR